MSNGSQMVERTISGKKRVVSRWSKAVRRDQTVVKRWSNDVQTAVKKWYYI